MMLQLTVMTEMQLADDSQLILSVIINLIRSWGTLENEVLGWGEITKNEEYKK